MTEKKNLPELLPVGTLLGNRYRIVRYLSSGGFGNTYVATDCKFDGKEVAIKELFIKGICGRAEVSSDVTVSLTDNRTTFDSQREKFRKEACRLRDLNHTNIIRVYDLFEEHNTSYYVMDYVRGKSLSVLLRDMGRPLSEKEMMPIFMQVLDALEVVHNQNIWHLDLKPGNIMVEMPSGKVDERVVVKLIDFGASKQITTIDGKACCTSMTSTYTQGYAPLEQIERNFAKFGPWTDIYGLGATMFNLLTNSQPPSSSDLNERGLEMLQLPKDVSPRIGELILWMMQMNRLKRPANIQEVRDYLVKSEKEKPLPGPVTPEFPTGQEEMKPQKTSEQRKKKIYEIGGEPIQVGRTLKYKDKPIHRETTRRQEETVIDEVPGKSVLANDNRDFFTKYRRWIFVAILAIGAILMMVGLVVEFF